MSSIWTLISCKDASISVSFWGWKVILAPSPYQSKLVSYSQEWHSTAKSSVANRGCLIQMFSEFILTKITGTDFALGCAKHLFTIIPKGKLEWAACSMKQVAACRGLLIAPQTVMVECPGMHSSYCSLPTTTCSIKPSLLLEKCWRFFIRGVLRAVCMPDV